MYFHTLLEQTGRKGRELSEYRLGKNKHVKKGASDALTYLDILSNSSCSGSVSHQGQSQGCVNDPADDPVLMTLCTLL